MPARKLKEFLDSHHVKYVTISHSRAYTAQEIAASAHIPGREIAKTVMVMLDGTLTMCVLPGSREIDFGLLKKAVGAKDAHLAREEQFAERFPDCETGAMPPFGNLYDLPVYAAKSLTEDEEIAFSACSHTELVRMKFADFARLVNPTVAQFSVKSIAMDFSTERSGG